MMARPFTLILLLHSWRATLKQQKGGCFISLRKFTHGILYSYFMLQQAIVQNIFPEVQVPTWQALARGQAKGNSMSSRYLHRGENVLHYCLFKLEITVLLPNYIYSHVTYVTRQ